MSEIPCDCCNTEGDNPSRIICDACFESVKGKAKCCMETQAENKRLENKLAYIIRRFPEVQTEIDLMEQVLKGKP